VQLTGFAWIFCARPIWCWRTFRGVVSRLPLIICGVLKIVYDVLLLLQFRHLKPPEERDRR
jgi:hypothetical protein